MISYGILSTSSITPRFIAAVKDTDHSRVAAIASRNKEKAAEKAALWGVPKSFGSYEELLQEPGIDVIYVSMVNSQHYEYTKRALLTGHHVLCEKPFTLDKDQSKELFDLAEEKGLFLMEAEKVVFLPVMEEIKRLIGEGIIGEVTMADFSSSFDPGYNSWFFNAEMGGGPLYGNAIYSLELMDYLFESPVTTFAGNCTRAASGIEDQFSLSWTLDCGILVTNKTSIRSEISHSAFLYGTEGYIEIPSYWKARTAIIHRRNSQEPITLSYPCEHELVYEIDHVHSCLSNNLITSPVMTPERTITAIDVLNRMRDAMK